MSFNNNFYIIDIIYLQYYNKHKKNNKINVFLPLKINVFLAYFFQMFFSKPRPRIKNLYKYKIPNTFMFLWALNVAKDRVELFKVRFIEFIYNFYKQIVEYIY